MVDHRWLELNSTLAMVDELFEVRSHNWSATLQNALVVGGRVTAPLTGLARHTSNLTFIDKVQNTVTGKSKWLLQRSNRRKQEEALMRPQAEGCRLL